MPVEGEHMTANEIVIEAWKAVATTMPMIDPKRIHLRTRKIWRYRIKTEAFIKQNDSGPNIWTRRARAYLPAD